MLDSMILWMKMMFFLIFFFEFIFLFFHVGLNEPPREKGYFGNGVWGFKPWFYTFWGSEGVFWGLVRLAHSKQEPTVCKYLINYIIHIDINIILSIYLYRGAI
jgi:hypothetical protein